MRFRKRVSAHWNRHKDYKFNFPKIQNHHNGHLIYFDHVSDCWRYSYDNLAINEDRERPCVRCKLPPTKEGHDPCIANLPGVENACCGHGVSEGYIAFTDGRILRVTLNAVEGAVGIIRKAAKSKTVK